MRAQVKIRGMRVEQGEIEDALRACKGVEGAAVRVLQHPNTHQTCIVGYLSPAGQDQASILQSCRRRLQEHMVPVTIVDMASLPCMSNGKNDHKALPDPDWEALAEGEQYVAPRDDAEHRVAAVWRDVLKAERIGVHANFFAVGGTSLLAGMIAYRAGAEFGVQASVALLLRSPTIAELAAKLSRQPAKGQGPKGIPGGVFSPEEKAAGVPLSFNQEQMV